MSLTERVLSVVREQYREEERAEVEALLTTYGTEAYEGEGERVRLDVLKLAEGEVDKVRELVACAKRDYRDVVLWAEYPEEARLDTPEKVRAFNAMLERLGAGWRVPKDPVERSKAVSAGFEGKEAAMDTLERNKRVTRRFVEEVVNTGDVALLRELVAEECVETDGKVRIMSGVEGMAEHVLAVRAIYPDLRVTIERQIAEGEWVATVITARGTHAMEWLGMAPTHKALVFTGVNVDRVVDGKMVEHGGAANMLEPFLTAGALKPVGE